MSINQTFNSYYHRMNYTEIEMEGMKEILRDKEEEIKKLKSDLSLVIKERDDNIEQNKKLKSDLAFKNTMLDNVSAEYDCSQDVIKKLKEDNRFLTKISKEYMKKENIVEVAEFTELYKDELEEENRKLKERVEELEQCNLNLQTWIDNKEKVNKSLREENKRLSDFLECES